MLYQIFILIGLIIVTLLTKNKVEESPPTIHLYRHARTEYHFQDPVGTYLTRISENWLKLVPAANPAILEMFRDRDRKPWRRMEPWAGEFAGKYLTGAVEVYRLTHDEELKKVLTSFVAELISLQGLDGYLGPWPEGSHLTGYAPNMTDKGGPTWDAWGHYHIMQGLLHWYLETNDTAVLQAARKIGMLFCDKFLGEKKPRLVDTGSTEMNLAPVDVLCQLSVFCKEKRFLDLAEQIVKEFAALDGAGKPLAGDYLQSALNGKEFFQSPKPRWESLHPIMGLARLYYLTRNAEYYRAFQHWWWSIVKLDRHNNGGFSSGEQAQGNPFHRGAIETCCTIAWLAMSVEMLKLTGNSIVADELELSTLNSGLGLHSPSGRWCTYNTPMDGVRKASAHEIVFQSREGSPELNCCSVNSARSLGLISEWALLHGENGVYLNWYGPGTLSTPLQRHNKLTLTQQTDYPRKSTVIIKVQLSKPATFELWLRIPHWSKNTTVKVNGEAVKNVRPGCYASVDRLWQTGDTIQIEFDFSLHYWMGEKECKDTVSIYRGPILLTYDRRFNETIDPPDLLTLDAVGLQGKMVEWKGRGQPIMLLEFPTTDGKKLRLCDFASAGDAGSPYISWLKVKGVKPVEFSHNNPLRSGAARR